MKSKTLIMKTAELEAATEAMAAAMGLLSTQIVQQEEMECPDWRLIQEIETKMEELQRERNNLDPDDGQAISAVLHKYRPKAAR